MSANAVFSGGFANNSSIDTHDENRSVHQLSVAGHWVMLAKTSTTTIGIYHSTNKTAWTLRGTFTVTAGRTIQGYYASAVDASNNVHIVCIYDNDQVAHVLMTYSAGTPTWTQGTIGLAQSTANPTHVFGYPSVEALDSGAALIGWMTMEFAIPEEPRVHLKVRLSGGTFGSEYVITPFAAQAVWGLWGMQLARDAGGASSNVQKCAVASTGGEYWYIDVVNCNVSTGAITYAAGPYASIAGTYSIYTAYQSSIMLFSTGANQWTVAAWSERTNFYASRFSLSGVNFVWTPAVATTLPNVSTGGMNYTYAYVTAVYANSRLVFIGTRGDNAGDRLEMRGISFTSGNPVVEPGVFSVVDMGAATPNASGYFVHAGNNRHFTDHLIKVYNWQAGNSDDLYAYFQDAPTTVPLDLVPVSGATITTDTPTLQAVSPDFQRAAKMQWQLATDSGFSSNLRTVTEADEDYSSATGPHVEVVPTGSKLTQTTWHFKAAQVDIFGQVGTYSTSYTFLVSHPPAPANLSPTGDVTRDFAGTGVVTLDWDFTDPSPTDSQTAYQVLIEKNSDGTSVLDTGKVVSGTTQHAATILAANKDIQLRWRVRLWDTGDVAGSYSANQLFRISDKPTVVITSPAEAGVVATPQPTVTWTFTASGGRTQAQRRIVWTQGATTIFDSGWHVSSGLSYTMPQALLVNSSSYSVTVYVQDNVGLQNSDTNAFTTLWTPPAVPSAVAVSVTPYADSGYVSVTWNAAVRDADFYAWAVIRRIQGETAFEQIYYTTSPSVAAYQDWSANSGVTYEYAVLQVANRFGTLVNSATTWLAAVTPSTASYWLIHPLDNAKNIRLEHVTSDDFSEEYEMETLNLIGRGRKRDYGTRFGFVGSITAQIFNTTTKTARQQKQDLESVKGELRDLYLRTPFGDTWLVAVGDLTVSRIAGVGIQEMCTVQIPYAEVG